VQNEFSPEAPSRPTLTRRSIQALAATQAWARLAGIALLVLACVELALGVTKLFYPPALPANLQFGPHGMLEFTALHSILDAVMVIIYAATGWYALRYARKLEQVRPPLHPDSRDIVVALGAQHRYWRLQGVATIVFIGLSFVFIIAITIISVGLAVKH